MENYNIDKKNSGIDKMHMLMRAMMPAYMINMDRQPVLESLKAAVLEVIDHSDERDMIYKSACAFLDAATDEAAASAMALLYCENSQNDDSYDPVLKSELDKALKTSRAVYLTEYRTVTGDDSYDELIMEREFRERASESRDLDINLIARLWDSLDVLLDGSIPDDPYKYKMTEHWFNQTVEKIIKRCDNCIEKADAKSISDNDISYIKKIKAKVSDDREKIRKVFSDIDAGIMDVGEDKNIRDIITG